MKEMECKHDWEYNHADSVRGRVYRHCRKCSSNGMHNTSATTEDNWGDSASWGEGYANSSINQDDPVNINNSPLWHYIESGELKIVGGKKVGDELYRITNRLRRLEWIFTNIGSSVLDVSKAMGSAEWLYKQEQEQANESRRP